MLLTCSQKMNITDERACMCALGKIFGFRPKTAQAILKHLGSASALFRMSRQEADEFLGPYFKERDKICIKEYESSFKELSALKDRGILYIGCNEEGYPPLLKECEDAPIGLYIRSETPPQELWRTDRNIAIVGTRDISPYGREWCERTVRAIADCGQESLIISGLALGTDITAHKTALECGLPTIAVMATGPETVYPYRHRNIAERIATTAGSALITDYPPGTAPLAIHFLRRNRIIAGISHSTLLMESKIRGGGMMTARLAFSYDRDVFTLPGRIDDIRSQGCNFLIKNKIAEPITNLTELMENLGMKKGTVKENPCIQDLLIDTYGDKATRDLVNIAETVKRNRGISIEDIASALSLPYFKVSETCRRLESDGILSIDLLQRCSINTKFV